MKSILISFFILSNLLLPSQNEATKWFFGNGVGLDFMNGTSLLLNGSAMNAIEGCASISDPNGNLLFYTKGDTIWNKNHQIMANGVGLVGNPLCTQSCLILRKPSSINLYYVFTIDGNIGLNSFAYSVIDMSLVSGTGSITVKNNLIHSNGPKFSKITSVKHCNGVDDWVLIADANSDRLYAYLLTSTGLINQPVVSFPNFVLNSTNGIRGYLKASPNGKKLALASNKLINTSFKLMDFDNTTGLATNAITFGYPMAYGCEFSPDGSKLYVITDTAFVSPLLAQYDISSNTFSTIIASQTLLSFNLSPGALQLTPNGKIYISKFGAQSLGVINSPNSAGTNCNFNYNALSIAPYTCKLGLPNFAPYVVQPGTSISIHSGNISKICKGESILLTVVAPNSFTWNTGSNTSTIIVTPTVTTIYSVVSTGSDACNHSAMIQIEVNNCLNKTETLINDIGLNVFHNNFKNELNIVFHNAPENNLMTFEIYNANAEAIKSGVVLCDKSQSQNNTFSISTLELNTGVYIINCKVNNNRLLSKKFVIY